MRSEGCNASCPLTVCGPAARAASPNTPLLAPVAWVWGRGADWDGSSLCSVSGVLPGSKALSASAGEFKGKLLCHSSDFLGGVWPPPAKSDSIALSSASSAGSSRCTAAGGPDMGLFRKQARAVRAVRGVSS
jgi:hypothetical protein